MIRTSSKNLWIILVVMVLMTTVFGVVRAVSPSNIISYQGRLLDANGVPVTTGTASMTFKLYDSLTVGTCLWSNSSATCVSSTARSVTLTSGLFSENLGDTGDSYAAISDSVFGSDASVYLEVVVNGETLTPRKLITATPYAINASLLDGTDSTSFVRTGATESFDLSSAILLGTSALQFEGSGVDANRTIFSITNPTGTNTITFKNGSGTLAFLTDVPGGGSTNALNFSDFTEAMTIDAATTISEAAGKSLSIAATAAPTTDLLSVSNTGFSSITSNTNALSLDYSATGVNSAVLDVTPTFVGGAAPATMSGINVGTPAITAGVSSDTINGVAIGGVTDPGVAIASRALSIGSGWDAQLYFSDTSSIVQFPATGTLDFKDSAGASKFLIDIAGALSTFSTSLAVNGSTLSTTSGTFNLIDSGATTISFASAATALNIADAATTSAIDIGGVTFDGANTVSIATNSTSADTIAIGNANAATTLVLTGGNDWSIGTNGLITTAEDVAVNGGDITTTAATFNLLNANATTITFAGAATALNIADAATTSAIDIGGVTFDGTNTISIATNGTSADSVSIGNSHASTTIALTGGTAWSIGTTGLITTANDVAVNGGDMTTTAASFNLLNTNATTITFAGAATTLNIADAATTKAIEIGGVTADGTDTIQIATNETTADAIYIGNANATTFVTVSSGAQGLMLNDHLGTATTYIGGNLLDGASTVQIATNATSADAITMGNANASTTIGITGGDDWSIGTNGLITTAGDVAVNGGDLTSTSATFNFLDAASNSTTIDFGGVTANLGNTISIATEGTTADTISIGNAHASTLVGITGGNDWSIGTNGLITTAGDVAVNGGDITTTGSTFDLLNSNATTINFASAATLLNIDDAATTKTIEIGGVTADGTDTVSISTNETTSDAVYIGNVNAGTFVSLSSGAQGLFLNDHLGSATTYIGGNLLDGASTVQIATNSTSADTITIGNANASTTLALTGGTAWSVGTTGDMALNGGDLTSTSATFNFLDAASNSTTIDIGGVTTNLGNTISIATEGTSADTISIGNSHASTLVGITGGNDWSIGTNGLITTAGDVAVNGGDLTTTATTFNLLTANATTVNFATAATTLSINDSTASAAINIGGVTQDAANTIQIATGLGSADTIYIGNSNAGTAVNIDSGAAGINLNYNTQTSTINLGGTGGVSAINTINIATNGTAADTISIGNNTAGTTTTLSGGSASLIDFADFDVASTGATTIVPDSNVSALTLTGTNVTSGTLASLSSTALTNGKALSITATNTYTAGGPPFIGPISFALTNAQSELAGTYAGVNLQFTSNPTVAGNTEYGMIIANAATTNTTDIAVNGLLYINNSDTSATGSTAVTNGILIEVSGGIADGIVDAIDASATNITNALNIGANAIVGTNFGVDTSGNVTANFVTATGANGPYALCHETNTDGINETIKDCNGAPTADYAEQYPTETGTTFGDILVPGTKEVITNNGDHIVQLVKSTGAYTGPVAGIISNNTSDFTSAGYNVPESENPQSVALVGRVPVNVTNEGGAIHVGDFITTSSTAGKGMKANLAGRVIGMALSEFSGVEGQVMVQIVNTWYMGNLLSNDGTSNLMTDNVIVASTGAATASTPTFDSFGLALRGSAWNGSQAETVSLMMKNIVTDSNNYRLSVQNTAGTEVAYISDKGAMQVAGDMVIGGKLYPSDLGHTQTSKYIYYDGSAGPGGDFMRTNASGWSTGSYDFAEMFPSADALTSGDVVVFADQSESVKRSTAGDQTIAGIISTRPGFLAGENATGSYPVALAGRVPTNVTTENGAIKVGDALTISKTAGAAMKATKAGQIVGYALEPFDGSSNKQIVVFVHPGYWNGEATSSTPGTTNSASQFGSTSEAMTSLTMSGNINMNGNNIANIGRLAGLGELWSIESDGTIKTEGLMKNVITTHDNRKVETVAVTSPDAVITFSGSAELKDGSAEIRFAQINPDYNGVISAIAPIRVIATPNSPVSLFISEKDQNHFVVKSFGGSADNVSFDWMVTAYRTGFEPKEYLAPNIDVVSIPAPVAPSSTTPVASSSPTSESIPSSTPEPAPATPVTPAVTLVAPVESAPPVSPALPIIDSVVVNPVTAPAVPDPTP